MKSATFHCFTSINVLTVFSFIFQKANSALDPDQGRTAAQLVESRGYSLQTHEVETKDSYILTVWRIVSKENQHVARNIDLRVN